MPTDLSALPRAAVNRWLTAVRLPLTAATSLTRHGDDETWGPALAFDAFEAQVKGVVGTVLRNDDLRHDATVARERVARLRDAATLEAEAEKRRVQADEQLVERRQATQQRAAEAEDRAQSRKERIEGEESATKRRVSEQTNAQKQQAKNAEQAAKARLDDRERVAEQKRLKAEREALAERKQAVEAKGKTLELDKEARATKQKRQARP